MFLFNHKMYVKSNVTAFGVGSCLYWSYAVKYEATTCMDGFATELRIMMRYEMNPAMSCRARSDLPRWR